ncbi:3-hydroxyisobutyryl-CoA hydrolase-like protein 1, mitochondrial isoform X4 [Hevea brasiliensis]|uniref:3-hydroxyisobutyryl-CoA hydrolase-like protein 1, mitochondrial isoform X4 n=1 Tax=Hevea brasiliensis TaxID=3981 RepID=UPI0025D35F16|nr:3-hydroxyisobutyryl-CoA hydrolase-like protein 1, mitochondrial isoform X4 [Hevea brasiliensis]
MQGLKSAAALFIRWSRADSFRSLPHYHYRNLSSLPSERSIDDDLKNQFIQVLVEGKGYSRTAILNRPSALNALNTNMCARLQKLYKSWEDNPDIGFVAMKGSGRAFCAGGDIVSIYHLINQGKLEDCKEFFRTIYSFIYELGGYFGWHYHGWWCWSFNPWFLLPLKLLLDSTQMLWNMYLLRKSENEGEYLALSGETLNGAEMIACGLATHYSYSERLQLIEQQLGKLVTDDPSVIEATLGKYGDLVHPDKMSVLHRIETVDKCFSHDTVEEIFDALENEASGNNDAFCNSTIRRLKETSPLSLKVSLRSIREGRFQTLDQCLVREYRMSLQGISKNISTDFCEGVRARMVDKDLAPKWNPPSLEQVSEDMVEHYFSPLSELEPDLELPTEQREAFT